MSYEHGTPFVNLPQTVGTDPRDWFDTNEAFADLDAKLKTAYVGAEGATQDIEAVKADILNLEQADTQMTARVDGIDSRVGANEQGISRLTGEIADVDTDLKDSICAIEEASATAAYQHLTGTFFWYNDTLYKAITDIGVGNQIVPDTNCTTTNITTELLEGGGGDLEPRVAQLETDMGTLMFRVNGGNAQYSKDDGTTWVNFKNPVGTRSITANGTYDVTDYASANVNVGFGLGNNQVLWVTPTGMSIVTMVNGEATLAHNNGCVCALIKGDTYIGKTLSVIFNDAPSPGTAMGMGIAMFDGSEWNTATGTSYVIPSGAKYILVNAVGGLGDWSGTVKIV